MARGCRIAGILGVWVVLFLAALDVYAAPPVCSPCAGLVVDEPAHLVATLREAPELHEESVLYVKWPHTGGESLSPSIAELAAVGATPWLAFSVATPAPLLGHLDALDAELDTLAAVASQLPNGSWVQILWTGIDDPQEYAFLLKRSAVAVSGAQPEAFVATAPLSQGLEYLQELFDAEVAAYVDAVALAPGVAETTSEVAQRVSELDPGAAIVIDGQAVGDPVAILADAARNTEAGATVTFFDAGSRAVEALEPLKLIAREFSGDLALDPYSRPQGAVEAWSFVRGSDLALRVIAAIEPGADSLELRFPDAQLKAPAFVDPASGEPVPLFGSTRTAEGLRVEMADPAAVVLLTLERMGAEEIAGALALEEELTVEDQRQIPVEEIVRRLQAFEDAQARRYTNYRAVNTTHLRFQVGTGGQSVETTFRGPFFFRREQGFDWVWKEFLVNGIAWRGETIPEIPLIQPEKAAALPEEVTFSKEYRYSLRGTETVNGRESWIVDFAPAVEVEPGRTLYRGTVWVDREIYARVRTRAVQLGLEGEVLSNEETIDFAPLSRSGDPAPWTAASYHLPVHLVGQQLWSVLGGTTVVEREIDLSEVAIDPPDFKASRSDAMASEATMVRDTERGLRYLVKDKETGERVVQEEFDTKKRFIVAGVFADDALDYPIPLGGMNWLWFDWRGTGTQANLFFAGALLTFAANDPSFLGSKFDAGFDLFALAIEGTDNFYVGDEELVGAEVKTSNPNLDLKIGRPLGNFGKLDLQYQLGYARFSRGDETADEFTLPVDHLNHTFQLTGRYNRNGYRLRARGGYHRRDDWQPWGLPDSQQYSPDHKDYVTWGVGAGKTWHLPKFLKFGAEVEYVSGSDLDRFSKYDFSFFGEPRVHGYQSGKVRAEEAVAVHLNYGFDIGSVFRLDLVGDAAWATDEVSGLDREPLAGVGLVGTIVGPWQTVIVGDIGVAVAGPDDGVTALLTVLKLFKH